MSMEIRGLSGTMKGREDQQDTRVALEPGQLSAESEGSHKESDAEHGLTAAQLDALRVIALRKETLPPKHKKEAPDKPAAQAPSWNLIGKGGKPADVKPPVRPVGHKEVEKKSLTERLFGKVETPKEKKQRQLNETLLTTQIVQTSQQQTQNAQARFEVQRTEEVESDKKSESNAQSARAQDQQRLQKLQRALPVASAVTQSRVNTASSGAGNGGRTITSTVEYQVSQHSQTGTLLSTSSTTQTRDSVTQGDAAQHSPGVGPDGRPRDKR